MFEKLFGNMKQWNFFSCLISFTFTIKVSSEWKIGINFNSSLLGQLVLRFAYCWNAKTHNQYSFSLLLKLNFLQNYRVNSYHQRFNGQLSTWGQFFNKILHTVHFRLNLENRNAKSAIVTKLVFRNYIFSSFSSKFFLLPTKISINKDSLGRKRATQLETS